MTDPEAENAISDRLTAAEGRIGNGWDGVERRAGGTEVNRVVEAISSSNPIPTPAQAVVALVAALVVVAFSGLVMFNQFRLSDRLTDSTESQRRFRDSLSCFLIQTAKMQEEALAGKQPSSAVSTEILINCGFISVPGGRP